MAGFSNVIVSSDKKHIYWAQTVFSPSRNHSILAGTGELALLTLKTANWYWSADSQYLDAYTDQHPHSVILTDYPPKRDQYLTVLKLRL